MGRVQVNFPEKSHIILKQIAALKQQSMSDYVYACVEAHVRRSAETDDQIQQILLINSKDVETHA
jgi:hypothetical protein